MTHYMADEIVYNSFLDGHYHRKDKDSPVRSRTPKIQDIAQIAGVSTATVSRALSNPDVVAEATHRAVMDAVAKTGYRINHMARNLRRQRAGNIVALVPNLANPFFSRILAGMSAILSPVGYGLLIADTHRERDPADRLAYFLDSGMADGIVIFDGTLAQPSLATKLRVPVVMACEWASAALPSVRVANAEGAAIAIRHLAEHGHHRIGHIMGPEGNVLTQSRLQGMREAMQTLGLPLHEDWLFPGDFTMDSGAKAARHWQSMPAPLRPTAMFCASDEMACGFMGELQHAGLSIPEDISIIGFDDIEIASHLTPALTTIHQPREQIGEASARMVLGMIETNSSTAPPQILPVSLVKRNSVALLR